jgi:hypothetical protein
LAAECRRPGARGAEREWHRQQRHDDRGRASRGDATSGALDVVADVRPQQRLLELARDLRELRERLEAALRASGFFWRIMGATMVSKKAASRSSKCLYMVRCRGSTPYRKKSFTIESTM